MRKISLIVIHCSATRADRDFTAKDVDTAHRFRGFSCWSDHHRTSEYAFTNADGSISVTQSDDDFVMLGTPLPEQKEPFTYTFYCE